MSQIVDLGGMSPINDFCKRNSVGRNLAYELIRTGKLVAVKVGARTYVRHEDETAWRSALPKLGRAAA